MTVRPCCSVSLACGLGRRDRQERSRYQCLTALQARFLHEANLCLFSPKVFLILSWILALPGHHFVFRAGNVHVGAQAGQCLALGGFSGVRFKACDILILSMYRHSECYHAELERLPRLSALNRLQRHTTAAKPCTSDRQRSLWSPRKRPADPVNLKPSPLDMSGKRAVSLFSEPAHRRSTTGPSLSSGNLSQTPSLGI